MIADIIPIRSASSPAFKAYFVFFMPMLPKYSVIIYSVVSVEPCITDDILLIMFSGP